jgi:hypothetical protein
MSDDEKRVVELIETLDHSRREELQAKVKSRTERVDSSIVHHIQEQSKAKARTQRVDSQQNKNPQPKPLENPTTKKLDDK